MEICWKMKIYYCRGPSSVLIDYATILHFTLVEGLQQIATAASFSTHQLIASFLVSWYLIRSTPNSLRSRACAGGEGASWNVSWPSLMNQQKSLLESFLRKFPLWLRKDWAIWFSISAKVCLVYFCSHDLAAGTWTSKIYIKLWFSSIFSACLSFLQPNGFQVFSLVASLSLDRATAWAKGSSGYTAALLCSLRPGSYDDASGARAQHPGNLILDPTKNGNPKRKVTRLPIINFQGRTVKFRGCTTELPMGDSNSLRLSKIHEISQILWVTYSSMILKHYQF